MENGLLEQQYNKLQLTTELQEIFSRIARDSKYSSSELLKIYGTNPEFQEFEKYLHIQWQQLVQQIKNERQQHSEMSDQDFFKFQVKQFSTKIIDNIKNDYNSQLTPSILDRLNKFDLEVKYDENFEHDITSYADKGIISINTAYFAKNKTLEEQIAQAMGTMPHEIFHFVFKMLKPEDKVDERTIYQLADGTIASNFGMVGHMLNEGFVEKLSIDFCKRNNMFYTISPSYINFVNLCDYIMKNIPQLNEEFLMRHNYEDILKLCSPEVVEAYKQTERIEYANNFKLKMQDGTYRMVKPNEIVDSFNQIEKTSNKLLNQNFNYHIHTYRSGNLKYINDNEILQSAKESGIKILGFSDCIPNPDLILPDENNRMLQSEVDDYISSISRLKQNNHDMTILVGFEAEFDPMKESYLGDMRNKVDYMILNQRFVNRGLNVISPDNNPNYPILYANMISNAIESGIFDIVSNPDYFIRFRDTMTSDENKKLFDENTILASQAICEKARDMGIPIEIDMNSHKNNENENAYLTFWKVAQEIEELQILKNGNSYDSDELKNISQIIENKLIENDYNPVVARKNNDKLQNAYETHQENALTYETHMMNQIASDTLRKIDSDCDQQVVMYAFDASLSSVMQNCNENALQKNKNLNDEISSIAHSDTLSVDEKKPKLRRKNQTMNEVNQILSNQEKVIQNTRNNVLKAIDMGCETKSEYINMITQMTQCQSTKKENQRQMIEYSINNFQRLKSEDKTYLQSRENVKKLKLENNYNSSNGFTDTIMLILIAIFILFIILGAIYVLYKLL